MIEPSPRRIGLSECKIQSHANKVRARVSSRLTTCEEEKTTGKPHAKRMVQGSISGFCKLLCPFYRSVNMTQLKNHLTSNHLTHKFSICLPCWAQYRNSSPYCIVNDILTASIANHVSISTLLVLSAAFDSIDRSIPLSRLEQHFGVSGLEFSWFKSYLSNSLQFVSTSGSKFKLSKLDYGVPQGSVLGPVLFVLYTQPFSQILFNHSCPHRFFADDAQLRK